MGSCILRSVTVVSTLLVHDGFSGGKSRTQNILESIGFAGLVGYKRLC